MNPGSKPRSVKHSSGQKLIPVYKVPVGKWIRGQNNDLLCKVAVKNWFRYTRFRPETEPGSKPRSVVTHGCGQKLIPVYSKVTVKNEFRCTWLRPEIWSGVKTTIYYARLRSKINSGIHDSVTKTESGVKTPICYAWFRSKLESGIHGCSRKLNPGSIP